MQSAPPTMFPAVTTTRFRAKPAHDTRCGSCGKKRPMESSVMLATLCSKPAPMKANRHQKISKRRAVSSFARMPIHTARQTSALQRMARKNSSRSGAPILDATMPRRNSLAGGLLRTPELAVASASNIEPARFPAKLTAHTLPSAVAVTVRESAPTVITRLLPVNSSDPAKMTSVSATPNEAPITALVAHEPAACSGAPMAKMSTMPRPTYAPARMERTRYWRGLCRRRPALVRAAPAIALTVSCSTGSSRARLATDEDPPALDADLVGGDAHARVVETLARPQVETLLVDRRSDLRDSTAVADDSTGEDERLAEGIEVADGVDGVTGPNDGYLLACDERADAGAREQVVERANVLPGFLRRALDGDRVHRTASRKNGAFSCQVAGRCWARWRICTRLGSGAAEFTKVRKRDSFAGSSMVAFHSHR